MNINIRKTAAEFTDNIPPRSNIIMPDNLSIKLVKEFKTKTEWHEDRIRQKGNAFCNQWKIKSIRPHVWSDDRF